MEIHEYHQWELTPSEAIALQKELCKKILVPPEKLSVNSVAGVDVSYSKSDDRLFAAVCVFSYPEMIIIEEKAVDRRTKFPYIPGLLSFREIPPILEAFKKVTKRPDVILCDGQGIAHPRGFGLASHLGLLTGCPSIGCAKSRLVGEFAELGIHRGDEVPLYFKDSQVGIVLRTRNGVKPLYISPGYKIDESQCREIVLTCTPRYRIPVPIRRAHNLVNERRTYFRWKRK